MERFAKRMVPECRCATRSFQGRGGFVELHFNKQFVKNISKKLHNYRTTFWMKSLTQRWTESGLFSARRCMPVSVDEYASVSLNMTKYPWKCLHNVLTMPGLWICLVIILIQLGFEDALGSKCDRIWQGCICKCYTDLWIWLDMVQYASICLNLHQYALMSLNMTEHGLTLLNVPEHVWNKLNKLFWLCQATQYASSS